MKCLLSALSVLCVALFFQLPVVAQDYHFVSIENLIEQEIGRIVLPKIYERLNLKIQIHPRPGERAQKEAVTGMKDGEIMRIWSYGESNPTMIRVPTAYYFLETMAFIKKGRAINLSGKEDLKRYRLVKVRGVMHTDAITNGMPMVHTINGTAQMMRFLEKDRADVALTNTMDGILSLRALGYADKVVSIEKPLAVLELYHYVHKKHKALVPKIDSIIKEMKQSGELSRLVKEAEAKVFR
jgi:hypothetical protein